MNGIHCAKIVIESAEKEENIVANNYILYPYLSIFTDKVRVFDLPDKLWTLMETRLPARQVGVGGPASTARRVYSGKDVRLGETTGGGEDKRGVY